MIIKKKLKKILISAIGVLIGSGAGYLYYYFIGCSNGSCSITSDPINSSLYGAVLGGLLLNTFSKPKK